MTKLMLREEVARYIVRRAIKGLRRQRWGTYYSITEAMDNAVATAHLKGIKIDWRKLLPRLNDQLMGSLVEDGGHPLGEIGSITRKAWLTNVYDHINDYL
jgi:hypothetical protein